VELFAQILDGAVDVARHQGIEVGLGVIADGLFIHRWHLRVRDVRLRIVANAWTPP